MPITVKTDHKWRELKLDIDVPSRVLMREFSYQERRFVMYGFFRYRGRWYHVDEFSRIDSRSPLSGHKWEAYLSDTVFSGVLIRLSSDGERYQVGTYFG
jgi:hypothetical protein